jgi:hypothetical protein
MVLADEKVCFFPLLYYTAAQTQTMETYGARSIVLHLLHSNHAL